MRVIGLTGSFGSGKSTVARMLAARGVRVIDADKIVHGLLKPGALCFRRVVRTFGKSILQGEGIDRTRLAAKVFDSPGRLKNLTDILHPAAWKNVRRTLAEFKKEGVKVVVVDAPLLIEAGWDRKVDCVLVVRANVRQQMARIQKQRAISRNQILKRIRRQLSTPEKMRQADFVIDNRGTLKNTRVQVQTLYKKLLKPI